jgi:hypothetical protein
MGVGLVKVIGRRLVGEPRFVSVSCWSEHATPGFALDAHDDVLLRAQASEAARAAHEENEQG